MFRRKWRPLVLCVLAVRCLLLWKTDPTAQRHAQQSMIIVPRDTPEKLFAPTSVWVGVILEGYGD